MKSDRVANNLISATPNQDSQIIDNDEARPNMIRDFYELRGILSKSNADDAYCRSALYFAFTGRRKVWTIRHDNYYLVLLPHPNMPSTILIFFPFITSASTLAEQIHKLCSFNHFLKQFNHILLARIPTSIASELLNKPPDLHNSTLEQIEETKLDWAYPSYDVLLRKLVEPKGGKLKTYRKKLRKFFSKDVHVIEAKSLTPCELRNAVTQVNEGWIQAKLNGHTSLRDLGITSSDELTEPYQTLADLTTDNTSFINGIFLKRGESYIAFSFWERQKPECTVPCLAAMTYSYEKGLSEYLYQCIASQLMKPPGCETLCIGGSETASLDRFKKKLDPIGSHTLRTIKLSLRIES